MNLDTALERIRQLEACLVPYVAWTDSVQLTGRERQVLSMIMARAIATRTAIDTVLYGMRMEPISESTISVFVSKIRRKLRPLGITINTQHGVGFYMAPDMQKRARDLLIENPGNG